MKAKSKNRKGIIFEKTIMKMTDFLNLLSGGDFTSSQIQKLAKEKKMRSCIQIFSKELNYCVKKGNLYCFRNQKFEPIHAKRLIEHSNQYNEDSKNKKLLRLQGEENKIKLENSNIENLKIIVKNNINNIKLLDEEIILLKKKIDFQDKDNLELCNQIRKLETENSSLNESTFEVHLLREKIVRLENLLLAYFK